MPPVNITGYTSARGLLAETPDVIMTLVSYFCGLPGVPRKARKHWHYRAGFALKVTICRNNVTPLFADAAR